MTKYQHVKSEIRSNDREMDQSLTLKPGFRSV